MVSDKNAQNVEILSPRVAMAADLNVVNPDADITIIDSEALSADIGSAGTLADIIDSPDGGTIILYTVQPGDTVEKVAKLFNISTGTVRGNNGMSKTDVLHRGETLIILPVTGVKYTVKKGDTLAGIENKFKLSAEETSEFLSFNELDSTSKIVIGQELIIPGAEIADTVVAPTKKAPVKKGNVSVNTKAYTPATGTSNIVRDYFIRPLASSCRMSQGKHDLYAIDIACPTGTPIKAAADGTIIFAKYGWNGAFGNLIIMKHPNGMTTFYAHIKDGGIAVSQGQVVSQGDVIGYVGSTGRSTGPHVHFEVRGGGNPGFDKTGTAWKQ